MIHAIAISICGVYIFQLKYQKYQMFVKGSFGLYLISAAINYVTSMEMTGFDCFGIHFNSSDYLAVVFSLVLLLLLYSGNIISLFQTRELKSNSDPKVFITPLCSALIFHNSILESLIISGLNLYVSIGITAGAAGVLQAFAEKKGKRIGIKMAMRVMQSCFEGFVFTMTGSSFACWTVAFIGNLLIFPGFHIEKSTNYVKFMHFFTIFIFAQVLPVLMNPYLYTGPFYKIHAKNHYI